MRTDSTLANTDRVRSPGTTEEPRARPVEESTTRMEAGSGALFGLSADSGDPGHPGVMGRPHSALPPFDLDRRERAEVETHVSGLHAGTGGLSFREARAATHALANVAAGEPPQATAFGTLPGEILGHSAAWLSVGTLHRAAPTSKEVKAVTGIELAKRLETLVRNIAFWMEKPRWAWPLAFLRELREHDIDPQAMQVQLITNKLLGRGPTFDNLRASRILVHGDGTWSIAPKDSLRDVRDIDPALLKGLPLDKLCDSIHGGNFRALLFDSGELAVWCHDRSNAMIRVDVPRDLARVCQAAAMPCGRLAVRRADDNELIWWSPEGGGCAQQGTVEGFVAGPDHLFAIRSDTRFTFFHALGLDGASHWRSCDVHTEGATVRQCSEKEKYVLFSNGTTLDLDGAPRPMTPYRPAACLLDMTQMFTSTIGREGDTGQVTIHQPKGNVNVPVDGLEAVYPGEMGFPTLLRLSGNRLYDADAAISRNLYDGRNHYMPEAALELREDSRAAVADTVTVVSCDPPTPHDGMVGIRIGNLR